MKKKKTDMPADLKKKCHAAIHSASIAAGASGLIPIPVADTVPISAAQVAMVVALGKVFDINVSESVARAVVGVGIAQKAGRTVVSSAFKCIPGIGTVAGMAVGATTAAGLTETMGWILADDFYKIYKGEQPEGILNAVYDVKNSSIFNNINKKHGV